MPKSTKTTRQMQIERARKRVQLRAQLEQARNRRDTAAATMRRLRDQLKES